MGNLFGDLAFGLARILVAGPVETFLVRSARKFMIWLDPKVRARGAKIVVGGFLGILAYFLFPIVMSLLP